MSQSILQRTFEIAVGVIVQQGLDGLISVAEVFHRVRRARNIVEAIRAGLPWRSISKDIGQKI